VFIAMVNDSDGGGALNEWLALCVAVELEMGPHSGALVLLLLFATSAFAAAQNAPSNSPDHFTFTPKTGSYPMSFHVAFQYDGGRQCGERYLGIQMR
jgi:hypothetical protein